MNESQTAQGTSALELPEWAPRVRITAGVGSATQKTWNIRRAVTLIGSRRPAHIVLHDPGISKAHCVLVNTGTEVLLKDLHTPGGTTCQTARVDLTVLNDGDVITVGATTIQVAITFPTSDGQTELPPPPLSDPTVLDQPFSLSLIHSEQIWTLMEAVTLIGRHDAAPIWLDHEEIRDRHAIIFRYLGKPAVFSLGETGGLSVNGTECSVAQLLEGDRLSVGPLGLRVGMRTPTDESGTETALSKIDTDLESLRKNIAESWDRLNAWQDDTETPSPSTNGQHVSTVADEVAVDVKEAALRGQLHDVSEYNERIAQRETEVRGQLEELKGKDAELRAREADLCRRAVELASREHVLAQRWTRLKSAKCAACNRPYNAADSSNPDADTAS